MSTTIIFFTECCAFDFSSLVSDGSAPLQYLVLSFLNRSFRLAPGLLFHYYILGPSVFSSRLSVLMTMCLAQCRNDTVDHPSAVGGLLLPGPIIPLGPFIRLSAAPCGWMAIPASALERSYSSYCGHLARFFWLRRYVHQLHWGWLLLR